MGGVLGKPITFAYNKDFDSKFIRFHCITEHNLVTKNEWGYQVPWAFEFDIMTIAYMLFESSPNVDNLKLDTLLNLLNMKRKNPNIHDAKEDVELVTDWLRRAFKFTRSAYKRMRIDGP